MKKNDYGVILQNYGCLAQLVEHRTENPSVPGSIPGAATKNLEENLHPINKHERFLVGKKKGKRRAKLLLMNCIDKNETIDRKEKLLRNTTKLCSCETCGNPRRHFGCVS